MIEHEFPGLKKGIVYLDSACSALKMKSAVDAFRKVCYWGGCGGKRTTHIISQKVEEYFEYARNTIANFINADYNEIIFTSGTTDGFNKLSSSVELKKGDEVVLSAVEHNSVFLPFLERSKRDKFKINIIPLSNFTPDIHRFEKMLNPNVKVICLSMASNIFGGTINVSDFIRISRKKTPNAFIFLDAAQYIPTHHVNVKSLDCDALCFSGHKLGSPYGIGVLYIKRESMKKLNPLYRGGGTVKMIRKNGNAFDVEYLENYQGFEAGIQNYAGAYALATAVRKLNEISYEKIRNHISDIIIYAKKRLSKINAIKVIGTNIEEGSIISFIPLRKEFNIKDFEIFISMSKPKIALRTGRMCADLACIYSKIDSVVRISFFIYNTKKDIDILLEKLEQYITESCKS